MYRCNSQRGFLYDTDGYVNVWVDGSCLGNGQPGARAGYGVFYNWQHHLNAAEPVEGRATNNAGEIQGAIHVIKDCIRERVKYLRINTDSEFLCNAVDKWLPRWERNGFCKANGEPLANQRDFMELSKLLDTSSMQIEFIHVSGHSGDQYNDEADRLAREGAHQYGN